jgi:hypothetical protein
MGDMVDERARADQSWPGQTGGVAGAIHTARHATNPAYAGCSPSATYPIAATSTPVTYRHPQPACALEPLTVYEIMSVQEADSSGRWLLDEYGVRWGEMS